MILYFSKRGVGRKSGGLTAPRRYVEETISVISNSNNNNRNNTTALSITPFFFSNIECFVSQLYSPKLLVAPSDAKTKEEEEGEEEEEEDKQKKLIYLPLFQVSANTWSFDDTGHSLGHSLV